MSIRLVKLFQAKSDLAYEKFLTSRKKAGSMPTGIDSPDWNANIAAASAQKAESETWAKAAQLLRQELAR